MTATVKCPSLKNKRVSPHVLRHTTAIDLLQQGVEQSTIALWLVHESIETTQIYLDYRQESRLRYLGIEVEDALEMAEQTSLRHLNVTGSAK